MKYDVAQLFWRLAAALGGEGCMMRLESCEHEPPLDTLEDELGDSRRFAPSLVEPAATAMAIGVCSHSTALRDLYRAVCDRRSSEKGK